MTWKKGENSTKQDESPFIRELFCHSETSQVQKETRADVWIHSPSKDKSKVEKEGTWKDETPGQSITLWFEVRTIKEKSNELNTRHADLNKWLVDYFLTRVACFSMHLNVLICKIVYFQSHICLFFISTESLQNVPFALFSIKRNVTLLKLNIKIKALKSIILRGLLCISCWNLLCEDTEHNSHEERFLWSKKYEMTVLFFTCTLWQQYWSSARS